MERSGGLYGSRNQRGGDPGSDLGTTGCSIPGPGEMVRRRLCLRSLGLLVGGDPAAQVPRGLALDVLRQQDLLVLMCARFFLAAGKLHAPRGPILIHSSPRSGVFRDSGTGRATVSVVFQVSAPLAPRSHLAGGDLVVDLAELRQLAGEPGVLVGELLLVLLPRLGEQLAEGLHLARGEKRGRSTSPQPETRPGAWQIRSIRCAFSPRSIRTAIEAHLSNQSANIQLTTRSMTCVSLSSVSSPES